MFCNASCRTGDGLHSLLFLILYYVVRINLYYILILPLFLPSFLSFFRTFVISSLLLIFLSSLFIYLCFVSLAACFILSIYFSFPLTSSFIAFPVSCGSVQRISVYYWKITKKTKVVHSPVALIDAARRPIDEWAILLHGNAQLFYCKISS